MEMAHRGYKLTAEQGLEIPQKYDSRGRLPLDLILDNHDKGLPFSMFKQPNKRKFRSLKILKNIVQDINSYQTNVIFAAMLFDSMKDYSFASAGMKMAGPLIQAILLNVPKIEDYLLSRCCRSENQPYLVQHNFLKNHHRPGQIVQLYDANGKDHKLRFGVTEAQVWDRKSRLAESLFEKEGTLN